MPPISFRIIKSLLRKSVLCTLNNESLTVPPPPPPNLKVAPWSLNIILQYLTNQPADSSCILSVSLCRGGVSQYEGRLLQQPVNIKIHSN